MYILIKLIAPSRQMSSIPSTNYPDLLKHTHTHTYFRPNHGELDWLTASGNSERESLINVTQLNNLPFFYKTDTNNPTPLAVKRLHS